MRVAKIVIEGQNVENIEEIKTFKYLVCNITNYTLNLDINENAEKYNKNKYNYRGI